MLLDYTIHRRGVRISVDATASRPPGRGQTWTVESGYWRADGASEKAAVDVLTVRLRDFLTRYRPPTVLTFRGYTAVVSLELGDADHAVRWSQRIAGPDGRIHHTGFVADSWDAADAHARHDLARRSTDWHDDVSVQDAAVYLHHGGTAADDRYGPDDLYRYAAWQRAARVAMDADRDDWHAWATRHQSEFTLPRPTDADG